MDIVIFVAPAHEDDVPILRRAHKALIVFPNTVN